MRSTVEIAVDTFIRAWSEPDAARRASMLDACFAEDGRFVTRSRELRGRSELAAMITLVVEDPQVQRIRLTSVVDAIGTTFRYRAVAERPDGTTTAETLDTGEIDADGRIKLVLTFTGPLRDADS